MTKLLTISFDSTNGDFCVEINKDELHSKELIALGLNSLYKELPDILPSSIALALYISEDPDYFAGILNYRVHRIISYLEDYSILNPKKI
ncbi:MAG: hypothetical protein GXY75_03490 [Bacteroidales bacterium]|jgi:hypothetical protein|nr:hypothetical protein [Bacteroidales bacterium]